MNIQTQKKDVKLAVVLPTRGDRPQFLQQAFRLIEAQSRQPDQLIVMDKPPEGPAVDLCRRYREGCEKVDKSITHVVFWEDDDWYSEHYLATMESQAKVDDAMLIGVPSTVYYHVGHRCYRVMEHPERASMMQTVIRREAVDIIPWPSDSSIHVDISIWRMPVIKAFVMVDEPIAVGIKHGVGTPAGMGHTAPARSMDGWEQDSAMRWLEYHVDEQSAEFYRTFGETPK